METLQTIYGESSILQISKVMIFSPAGSGRKTVLATYNQRQLLHYFIPGYSYLFESNLFGVFSETLPTDVQAVLSYETMSVATYSATTERFDKREQKITGNLRETTNKVKRDNQPLTKCGIPVRTSSDAGNRCFCDPFSKFCGTGDRHTQISQWTEEIKLYCSEVNVKNVKVFWSLRFCELSVKQIISTADIHYLFLLVMSCQV